MGHKNSYTSRITSNVKSYITYEKDFTNPGQFIEEEDSLEISLMTEIFPGWFDGKKWVTKSDDSYHIYLYYQNKNHVNIYFAASLQSTENVKGAWVLVKEAAKKFFLVNDFFSLEHYNRKYRLGSPNPDASWEEVEFLIGKYFNHLEEKDIREGNSWSKTMTVDEARELFKYLKIEIDFPS